MKLMLMKIVMIQLGEKKSYEFSNNADTKDEYSVVVKMNVKAVQKLDNTNP